MRRAKATAAIRLSLRSGSLQTKSSPRAAFATFSASRRSRIVLRRYGVSFSGRAARRRLDAYRCWVSGRELQQWRIYAGLGIEQNGRGWFGHWLHRNSPGPPHRRCCLSAPASLPRCFKILTLAKPFSVNNREKAWRLFLFESLSA
jgi:hypothetical protein